MDKVLSLSVTVTVVTTTCHCHLLTVKFSDCHCFVTVKYLEFSIVNVCHCHDFDMTKCKFLTMSLSCRPLYRTLEKCAEKLCPVESYCKNSKGSYTCTCKAGYAGKKCLDKDECTRQRVAIRQSQNRLFDKHSTLVVQFFRKTFGQVP